MEDCRNHRWSRLVTSDPLDEVFICGVCGIAKRYVLTNSGIVPFKAEFTDEFRYLPEQWKAACIPSG